MSSNPRAESHTPSGTSTETDVDQYAEVFEDVIDNGPFPIRFPKRSELDQDQEWCEVEVDGSWQRIRFHDYNDVYNVPGLYETIFYRTLRCNSPHQIVQLLNEVLVEHNFPTDDLRVLDVGAGNGMVGEALQTLGTRNIVGIDVIPEAKEAADRDRPWVYNDYLVADLTQLTGEQMQRLRDHDFNSMTTVAALGFGDIPPEAFGTAYNLVNDGGWIAFNIKEDFLRETDCSGFAGLIQQMTRKGLIQLEMYKRYCHRLNIAGEPLYYIAVVGQKLGDIPESLMQD